MRADSARTDTSKVAAAKKKSDLTDTVSYEADRIDYDMENKYLTLTGNAMVRYQNMTLYADTITYETSQSLFSASGRPTIIEGADTTVGEYMTYNIKTRRGSVQYASMHMDEAYFNGRSIVKQKGDEFYAGDGDYTTCAYPDDPHYHFYGRVIKAIPKDKVYARPAIFNIGDVPVGILPYMVLPMDRKRTSGILTPTFSGTPGYGFALENIGYYLAPNDYVDFLAAARIEEFKSFVLRAESRYALRYWLNGSLSGRYALTKDYAHTATEWAIDYSHNQTLTPDRTLTFGGRGNLASRKDFYTRHSSDSLELLGKQMNANLALAKRFERINASANLSWSRNQNLKDNVMSEDLPNISFNLPGRPLIPEKTDRPANPVTGEPSEPKWYNRISHSYNAHAIRKHFVDPKPVIPQERDYARMGAEQNFSLSYNQKILKYITFSPSFNFRSFAFDAYKDTFPDDTIYHSDSLIESLPSYATPDSMFTTHRVIDTVFDYQPDNTVDTYFVVARRVTVDTTLWYKPTFKWDGNYTWNLGASLGTTLYGMFPIHFLRFAGLRHTFSPSISYTFNPRHDASGDKQYYPIGIGGAGASPMNQSIGFSIGNSFDGKTITPARKEDEKPEEKRFHIVSINLGTSYGYRPAIKDWKWTDLSLSANTTNKLFSVGYSSVFWLYDIHDNIHMPILRSYDVRISPQVNIGASGNLWEGDRVVLDSVAPTDDPLEYQRSGPQPWNMHLSPSFSFSQSRTRQDEDFTTTKNYALSASADLSFTRKWSMSWSSTYNFTANQFVGHSLDFKYDAECWALRFNWRPSGYNPGFYFLIQVKKIPDIKWEQRS